MELRSTMYPLTTQTQPVIRAIFHFKACICTLRGEPGLERHAGHEGRGSGLHGMPDLDMASRLPLGITAADAAAVDVWRSTTLDRILDGCVFCHRLAPISKRRV